MVRLVSLNSVISTRSWDEIIGAPRADLNPQHFRVEGTGAPKCPRPQRASNHVSEVHSPLLIQGAKNEIQEPFSWGQYSFVGGKKVNEPFTVKSSLTREVVLSTEKPRVDYGRDLEDLVSFSWVTVVVGK